jgi:hypothetical protein
MDQASWAGTQACLRFTNWNMHSSRLTVHHLLLEPNDTGLSWFDLNTTMHYIGCMYVGNKPAACSQTDFIELNHLRESQTVIGNKQSVGTDAVKGLGERTEGLRCQSLDGSRCQDQALGTVDDMRRTANFAGHHGVRIAEHRRRGSGEHKTCSNMHSDSEVHAKRMTVQTPKLILGFLHHNLQWHQVTNHWSSNINEWIFEQAWRR